MASTTKIMTSIIVIENVSDLTTKTKISSKAAGTGGSRLGLHTNDEITIEDLLYGLMLCSGNDARSCFSGICIRKHSRICKSYE